MVGAFLMPILQRDDLMRHTPFGYRTENGMAVIDETAAAQVRDY